MMMNIRRFWVSLNQRLLRRIKNQNIEAEIQKLIVETLGPLQGKHEVFKDGAIKWRLPLLKSMELEMYV